MIILERLVQKVRPDKWAALEKIEKKYNAIESRFGFPAKKRYQCLVGGHDTNTIIIERQWESMAVMEATYEKIMADPQYQKLGSETIAAIESNQIEYFTLLP